MALEAGEVQQYATIMLALSVVLTGNDDAIDAIVHDASSSTTTDARSESSAIEYLLDDEDEDETIVQTTHALLVEIMVEQKEDARSLKSGPHCYII